MRKLRVNLGRIALIVEIMVAVPQMIITPVVLAQSQGIQEALRLTREGEQLRLQGTRESFQQALEKFQRALVLVRAARDRTGELSILDNIGLVYSNLGQSQQALNYHQQSLTISRETGNRRAEGTILNNLALAYSALRQREQAFDYLQQALVITREVADRRGEATTLNHPKQEIICRLISLFQSLLGRGQSLLHSTSFGSGDRWKA
jgi:tetratricopeptide (TPR) repeat protein